MTKDEQIAHIWYGNIQKIMIDGLLDSTVDPCALANKLNEYKKLDEKRLIKVLSEKVDTKAPRFLMSCVLDMKRMPDPSIMITHLKTFLEFGANLNTPDPYGEYPLTELLNSEEPRCRIFPYQFPFIEQVKLLIDKGANLSLTTFKGLAAVHNAAQYDTASLKYILDKDASQATHTTPNGETPLFYAVRAANESAVLELLITRKVDVHHKNSSGHTSLSVAIESLGNVKNRKQTVNEDADVRIVKYLFTNGVSIDPEKSVRIPSHPRTFTLISRLALSGYFLAEAHIKINEDYLRKLLGEKTSEDSIRPFLSIEDEKTKVIEHYFTGDELRASKLQPSNAQIKRLRLSFSELNNSGADNGLMLAFSEKYPVDQGVIAAQLPPQNIPLSNIKEADMNIHSLTAILNQAITGISNADLMEKLKNDTKAIFASKWIDTLNETDTKTFIMSYSKGVIDYYTKTAPSSEYHIEYDQFLNAINNRFIMQVFWKFIRSQSDADMKRLSAPLHAATNTITVIHYRLMSMSSKSLINTLHFLNDCADKYKKNMNYQDRYYNYLISTTLIKIQLSMEYRRVKETMAAIRLLEDQKIFDKCGKAANVFISSFRAVLLNIAQQEYAEMLGIDNYIHIIEQVYKLSPEEVIQDFTVLSRNFINGKYQQYFNKEYKQNDRYTLVFEEGKLFIQFSSAYNLDHKRLSRCIKSNLVGEKHYIEYYGLTKTAAISILAELNNLKLDDFTKKLSPKSSSSPSNNEQKTQVVENIEADMAYKYSSCVLNSPSSSSSSSGLGKPESPKSKITVQAPLLPYKQRFAKTADEIKQRLIVQKVDQTIELYHIDDPFLAEDRKHLTWGYWAEVTGQGADRLNENLIERHKKLLEMDGVQSAKIAMHSRGENGLRYTRYHDANKPSERIHTLKTKITTDDERFVASPLNIELASGDVVRVYRFGDVRRHK